MGIRDWVLGFRMDKTEGFALSFYNNIKIPSPQHLTPKTWALTPNTQNLAPNTWALTPGSYNLGFCK